MEELLEMITWSQLGIHNKPVGLLHVDGYYDPLLALFDKGMEEGFIKPSARYIVLSASLPRQLLDTMEVSISVYPHLPKPSSFFDLFWSFFIYWQTSLLGIVAYYR